MADKLREARRRRILENSEKRMQKILGLTEHRDAGSALPSDSSPSSVPTITAEKEQAAEDISSQLRCRVSVAEGPIEEVVPRQMHPPMLEEDLIQPLPQPAVADIEKQVHSSVLAVCLIAVAASTIILMGYGSWIGNNALVPFLFIAVYKVAFVKAAEGQPGGMLSTAIMLSGLPKEKITSLVQIWSSITSVGQDLCLYLFIFLLSFRFFQVVM